jgi:hypothetical protein
MQGNSVVVYIEGQQLNKFCRPNHVKLIIVTFITLNFYLPPGMLHIRLAILGLTKLLVISLVFLLLSYTTLYRNFLGRSIRMMLMMYLSCTSFVIS